MVRPIFNVCGDGGGVSNLFTVSIVYCMSIVALHVRVPMMGTKTNYTLTMWTVAYAICKFCMAAA